MSRTDYAWCGLLAAALLCVAPIEASAGEPGESGNASVFRTAPVVRGDLVVTIAATGTVEPEEVVDVGAQVAGRVVRLGPDPQRSGKTVDYGSVIEKDTVLAQIDPAPYEAQLEHARAGCTRAEAELLQTKAKLQLAEIDWRRIQTLAKNKAISEAEIEAAKANFEVARAGIVVAEAGVAQSRAVLKQAQLNLDDTVIRSPVKGVVIARRVGVGQAVPAGLNAPSLFLIAKDLGKLQVWASVNEADIGRIRAGQAASFTVDAFPGQVFLAKVEQVRLNAQMTQNVVTYTVVLTTANPDGKLLPYLTANVKFEVHRRNNVLLVPAAALRWRPRPQQIAPDARKPNTGGTPKPAGGEHGQLWVPDGEFVRPVEVQVGEADGLKVEVSGDHVKVGMEVVIGENTAATDTGGKPQTVMEKALAAMGSNLLLVLPGAAASGGVSWGAGSVSTLTSLDADEIARQCPAVVAAAPIVRVRGPVVYGDRNWVPSQINGTTPAFLAAREWEAMAEGEAFTDRDVRNAAKVCLIGETLKRELFQGRSPVGQDVRIRNIAFRVIGVLAPKGDNVMGMDQDDVVLAPWTTIKYRVAAAPSVRGQQEAALHLGPDAPYPGNSREPAKSMSASVRSDTVDQILVKAAAEEQVAQAAGQVSKLLRQRHRIAPGAQDDFNIRDMGEIKRALTLPRR